MSVYETKLFDSQVAEEPGKRWVLARITTTAVDRDGDVVLPSGGDFTEFDANPAVLMRHNDQSLPVAKAVGLRKRPNDVVATVVFAERPASHPTNLEWVPDTVHELFKQGVLRAFSMGFMIPLGGARPAEKKDVARFGDGVRRVITKWKLRELSIVPIPANQDALAIAVSKGWIPRDSWVRESMLGLSGDLLDLVDGRGDILDLDTTLEL